MPFRTVLRNYNRPMVRRPPDKGLSVGAVLLSVALLTVGCGSVAVNEQRGVGDLTITTPSEPTTSLAGEGLGDELADALVDELSGRFLSIGRGTDAVEIVLAPDEEPLASELLSRYGDRVNLSVGRLAYPLDDASSVCPDAPERRSQPDLGIEIVEPDGPVSASGVQSLQLSVRLMNISQSPISFSSGTAIGTITDLAGNVVSSGATSELTGEEIPIKLGPGESTDLALFASMASCDPALGYVLPPGDYVVVAEVVRIGGGIVRLHSEPQVITIGS